jgi:inorganic triphosphatase YgiF
MNTDTGNIFAILNNDPLAENEVELKAKEFAELFPIRDLGERLDLYRRMHRARSQDALETEPEKG